MHAVNLSGQFKGGVRFKLAGDAAYADQLHQQLQLQLGIARKMQSVGVQLAGQDFVEPVDIAGGIGLVALLAIFGAHQGNGGEKGVAGLGSQAPAQLEALDLGAQHPLDGPGLFGGGSIEQQRQMAQPVEHALGGQGRSPGLFAEPSLATDPVKHQGTGKMPLAAVLHVAEMAQPGKAVQVEPPVGMVDRHGKRRQAMGFDQLAGQQIAPRHHVAHRLAIGRAEFMQLAGKGIVSQAAPGPAQNRQGHDRVGKAKGKAPDSEAKACAHSVSAVRGGHGLRR